MFEYDKEFKLLSGSKIYSILKKENLNISQELVNFWISNPGGIVSNTLFSFQKEKHKVHSVLGFGSRGITENIIFNYKGNTCNELPDYLEIITFYDSCCGIFYSLKDSFYYFIDEELEVRFLSKRIEGLYSFLKKEK